MDDLISRKWLIECIDEGWIKFDTEKDANTYIHLVRDIAPSVEAEPVRHGKWLKGNNWQPCSVCRYRGRMSWNYCPNCGARMDGEQND